MVYIEVIPCYCMILHVPQQLHGSCTMEMYYVFIYIKIIPHIIYQNNTFLDSYNGNTMLFGYVPCFLDTVQKCAM